MLLAALHCGRQFRATGEVLLRPIAAGGKPDHANGNRLDRGDPREVHQMRTQGDEEVEYLVVGISAGQGGRTVVVSAQ